MAVLYSDINVRNVQVLIIKKYRQTRGLGLWSLGCKATKILMVVVYSQMLGFVVDVIEN